MHATKEPSYSECDEGAGIRLAFDRVAQRFLEAACRFTRGDCRLSIEFLSCTCGLIRKAFSLRSRIAGDLPNPSWTLPPRLRAVPSTRFSSIVASSV
jgi:hypothetical protein